MRTTGTHTFLAVCKLGSFTRAAAELHITQPAVSQHIRQLEAHYGCDLFYRRPTRRTYAGGSHAVSRAGDHGKR